jgi:hypothetical protein
VLSVAEAVALAAVHPVAAAAGGGCGGSADYGSGKVTRVYAETAFGERCVGKKCNACSLNDTAHEMKTSWSYSTPYMCVDPAQKRKISFFQRKDPKTCGKPLVDSATLEEFMSKGP